MLKRASIVCRLLGIVNVDVNRKYRNLMASKAQVFVDKKSSR